MFMPGNFWHPPQDMELWLMLLYVTGVLIGARVVETIARIHFAHAHHYAEHGFEYIPVRDHYQCLGGATLTLTETDPSQRLAIYHAPVEHCGGCRLKPKCAPLEKSRRVFRSLATFAETDVGRFHQFFSVVMFAAALVVSLAGVWHWLGQAGLGYLVLASAGSFACLLLHGRRMRGGHPQAGK